MPCDEWTIDTESNWNRWPSYRRKHWTRGKKMDSSYVRSFYWKMPRGRQFPWSTRRCFQDNILFYCRAHSSSAGHWRENCARTTLPTIENSIKQTTQGKSQTSWNSVSTQTKTGAIFPSKGKLLKWISLAAFRHLRLACAARKPNGVVSHQHRVWSKTNGKSRTH